MNRRSLLKVENQVKKTTKEDKIDLSSVPTSKLKEMLRRLESQEKNSNSNSSRAKVK